ncbi:redoxin domain-containing protein [Dasania marina]|uniref:redoxin domain-containing protein n=1 Tax=Dasania marina TaxID=471499 RepID=UPI00037D99AB|nr:redoxin domain-containing protein [Dasania marina]
MTCVINLFRLLAVWLLLATTAQAYEQALLNLPASDINGKPVAVSQLLGKRPQYIKFWASWCVPCNQQMPHFVEASQHYGDSLAFLSVNIDLNEDRAAVLAMIEKYGMSMPTVQDSDGRLSQAFDLLGTPLHILIDGQGRVVHKGHKVDARLKQRLAMLASSDSYLERVNIVEGQHSSALPVLAQQGLSALYFTATWCDWYLAESRPEQSKNCVQGQQVLKQLLVAYPTLSLQTWVSRLWTELADVADYKQKYQLSSEVLIDKNNAASVRYGVKTLPTLLLFKNGSEVLRIKDFSSYLHVQQQLANRM